jgi:hypothetical protein
MSINHHVPAISSRLITPNAGIGHPANDTKTNRMKIMYSTPSFAGLRGQSLVLAVTLTSGLGFLYER